MKKINRLLTASMLILTLSGTAFPVTVSASENAREEEKLYSAGSISKVYVTVCAMQLAEQGKIELDKPVTDYLPEFKMADERYKDITVRMLMDHSSGIMGTSLKNMSLYNDNDTDSYSFLLDNLRNQRLKADPGEYAAYCNDGFELLRLVVEKVSGMKYSEYLEKNITSKTGVKNTYVSAGAAKDKNYAQVYVKSSIPYDYEYCLNQGSGGIVASAADVAAFGSTFFKGDGRLLSEASKEQMAKRWNDKGADTNEFMASNSLGWDSVSMPPFSNKGIRVLSKGGDIGTQHAFLMVAPDEKISVSVLSSGGSSAFNALVSKALLEAALEVKGIKVEDEKPAYEISTKVPEEAKKFAGLYLCNGIPSSVSFDDSLMYIEAFGDGRTIKTKFKPCTDGSFIEVKDSGAVPEDYTNIFFEQGENGKNYIKYQSINKYHNLGTLPSKGYYGESILPNEVSGDAVNSWKVYDGRQIVVCSDKYSSATYDAPFGKFKFSDKLPGYCVINIMASRVLKIGSADRLESFQTIPGDLNRDLTDVWKEEVSLKSGEKINCFNTGIGIKYRLADELPEFGGNIKEISLVSEEPAWFKLTENGSIRVDRPENSVINVYNKYGDLIRSTHMKNCSEDIPLVKDGYILFAGENGGKISIR